MLRLIRKLFTRMPPRRVSADELELLQRRRELDEQLSVLAKQTRQRSALFLLEQEVDAITAARYHQPSLRGRSQ